MIAVGWPVKNGAIPLPRRCVELTVGLSLASKLRVSWVSGAQTARSLDEVI